MDRSNKSNINSDKSNNKSNTNKSNYYNNKSNTNKSNYNNKSDKFNNKANNKANNNKSNKYISGKSNKFNRSNKIGYDRNNKKHLNNRKKSSEPKLNKFFKPPIINYPVLPIHQSQTIPQTKSQTKPQSTSQTKSKTTSQTKPQSNIKKITKTKKVDFKKVDWIWTKWYKRAVTFVKSDSSLKLKNVIIEMATLQPNQPLPFDNPNHNICHLQEIYDDHYHEIGHIVRLRWAKIDYIGLIPEYYINLEKTQNKNSQFPINRADVDLQLNKESEGGQHNDKNNPHNIYPYMQLKRDVYRNTYKSVYFAFSESLLIDPKVSITRIIEEIYLKNSIHFPDKFCENRLDLWNSGIFAGTGKSDAIPADILSAKQWVTFPKLNDIYSPIIDAKIEMLKWLIKNNYITTKMTKINNTNNSTINYIIGRPFNKPNLFSLNPLQKIHEIRSQFNSNILILQILLDLIKIVENETKNGNENDNKNHYKLLIELFKMNTENQNEDPFSWANGIIMEVIIANSLNRIPEILDWINNTSRLDITSNMIKSYFMWALLGRNLDMIKMMIENWKLPFSWEWNYLFRTAVSQNIPSIDIIEYLIEQGVNINCSHLNNNHMRAIDLAIKYDNFNVVKLLLKHECDINNNTVNIAASIHHPALWKVILKRLEKINNYNTNNTKEKEYKDVRCKMLYDKIKQNSKLMGTVSTKLGTWALSI